MRELAAGLVILFVVGFGSFLYRNTMERPFAREAMPACTLEAKLCPDGSSVGRSGPSCAFSPCAFPNVELREVGISFLVPEGYEAAAGNALASFSKPSASGNPAHRLAVYRYAIPEGARAEDVLLRETRFQPADEPASSLERFDQVPVGAHTFYRVTVERFEGLVHTSYFLARESDVLRFDVVEHDVLDWTGPTFTLEDLPEHRALRALLASLQLAS